MLSCLACFLQLRKLKRRLNRSPIRQLHFRKHAAHFFANVGGSPFAGVQTQYCQGILPGFSCAGDPSAQFITNPTGQLKGTWVDPSPVPADITSTGLVSNLTTDPLEAEAIKASQHFGYDVNATINIFTEPGHTATLYGSVYCAYHSETGHTTGHGVRYAFVPYVPEQGGGCGQNMVNATNDAFGHGYLDGYSIVAGHEYAEAVTDPGNQSGVQDGWNDATSSEIGKPVTTHTVVKPDHLPRDFAGTNSVMVA